MVDDEDHEGLRRAQEQAFVEHGKWLLDWQWRRTDALERKASYVLAFSGVVLALLPVAADRELSTRGIARDTSAVALTVAALALLTGAAASAWAIRPRSVGTFNLMFTRSQWNRWKLDNPEDQVRLQRSIGQAIFRDGDSPLFDLSDDAADRGKWLGRSLVLNCAGVLALAVGVISYALWGGGG